MECLTFGLWIGQGADVGRCARASRAGLINDEWPADAIKNGDDLNSK